MFDREIQVTSSRRVNGVNHITTRHRPSEYVKAIKSVHRGDDAQERDPSVGCNNDCQQRCNIAKVNVTYMVTRFAWIAAKLVSSNKETRYASLASWRARTADDWKRRSVCVHLISNVVAQMHVQ
jgi:hypothetical protein